MQNAAIVLRQEPDPGGSWAAHTLRKYPGALLCGALEPSRVVVTLRDRPAIAARAVDGGTLPFDPAIVASAIYAAAVSGHLADASLEQLTITAGGHIVRVRLDDGLPSG
jgi:hypothetical protein